MNGAGNLVKIILRRSLIFALLLIQATTWGLLFTAKAETESQTQVALSDESRLRVGAGVMPFVGAAPGNSWAALGTGFTMHAAYQLGAGSRFLVGLTGGSLSGGTGSPLFPSHFDMVFVQPTILYRRMEGSVHPLIGLGVGPVFWNGQPYISAGLRVGLDIDLLGPLSLGIEPINVMSLVPYGLAWVPQLNLVATF